jgi:hypothetical protein
MIVGKSIRCTIKAWCIRKAIPIREYRRAFGRRGLDRLRGFGFGFSIGRRGLDRLRGFGFGFSIGFTVYYCKYIYIIKGLYLPSTTSRSSAL